MNKITKLIIAKKCLDMTKAQADIRGKEFTKVYVAFVNLFAWLFEEQAKFFIAYAENNPQLFSENWLIIEKSDEFGDMMPGEEFMNTLGSYLIKAHMIGQGATNKEVQSQVTVLMELKNSYAESYSANRAGELMRAVNDTTKAEVRTLFNKWFQENWSIKDISTAIDEQFAQFGKYRANLIATMEVANAYEVGKKDQFSSYQSYFWITGYKRSITQHDSNVRYTHNLNEIDGWILDTKLFSWTDTEHAPHGFNCRCVTTRKMSAPSEQDQLDAQFWSDKTTNFDNTQKQSLANHMQEIRRQLPWIAKPTYLENATGTTAMHYMPSKNVYWINPDVFKLSNREDRMLFITDDDALKNMPWSIAQVYDDPSLAMRASVAHEVWHAIWKNIDDYASNSVATKLNGTTWAQLKQFKDTFTGELFAKMKKWDINLSRYPLYSIEYLGEYWAKQEVFSEAVSAYWMWEYTRIDDDMLEFLDIIFSLS